MSFLFNSPKKQVKIAYRTLETSEPDSQRRLMHNALTSTTVPKLSSMEQNILLGFLRRVQGVTICLSSSNHEY